VRVLCRIYLLLSLYTQDIYVKKKKEKKKKKTKLTSTIVHTASIIRSLTLRSKVLRYNIDIHIDINIDLLEFSGGLGTDIIFVIDGSGSQGASNFQKIKHFVRDIVTSFDIGLNKTRVGLINFRSVIVS